jgi:para-nitrobenzyl esterase
VAKVPYLLGSNNDEGMLFLLSATIPTTEAEYQAELTKRYGSFASDVAAMYPVSKFGGDYRNALGRVLGDAGLVCGTHDTARRAAKAGLSVFMYNFNIPWSIAPTVLLVSHASEMSHVFGNPWLPTPDPGSKAVSDAMNAFWAGFATTGDPNFSGAPATWPAFKPDANDDDKRLQLDPGWEVLPSFRKAECAMWRKMYDAAFLGGDGGSAP